jgi:ADP-heptose:LPS heptosyltransferase
VAALRAASVVVVRAGALGDVLLLRRAIAALRLSGRRVVLIAPAGSGAPLVGSGPGEVERLLPWDGPGVARLLAGEPPDPELRDALTQSEAVLACTASTDVVASLRRLARHVLAVDPRPRDGQHASFRLAAPLRALGVDPQLDPPVLTPSPRERRDAHALAAGLPPGFLAVHPGSGSANKTWPPERFAALIRERAAGAAWLLIEGPADRAAVGALASLPGARVARGLPLRVLGSLLGCAGLYVGNDSGVSHLAAAFGAPTLALFGPTDPDLFGPLGPRVAVVRSPDASMSGLELAAVLNAASRLWSSPPAALRAWPRCRARRRGPWPGSRGRSPSRPRSRG